MLYKISKVVLAAERAAFKALPVRKVFKAQSALLVLLDPLVLSVPLGLRVLLDPLVLLVRSVLLEPLVLLALQVLLAQLAPLVLLA